MSLYSATKDAAKAFTPAAAVELAPRNIRVNAVAPGMTRTRTFCTISQRRTTDPMEWWASEGSWWLIAGCKSGDGPVSPEGFTSAMGPWRRKRSRFRTKWTRQR